jgi:uncharacterized protein YjbJ (UPF0337 family)
MRTSALNRRYSRRRFHLLEQEARDGSKKTGRCRSTRFVVRLLVVSVQTTTTAAFIARDFVLMKSSTKDKIKGRFREAKGEVKEKAGRTTRNPNLRDRGTAEKAGGKVQRKIGDLKKVFEQ